MDLMNEISKQLGNHRLEDCDRPNEMLPETGDGIIVIRRAAKISLDESVQRTSRNGRHSAHIREVGRVGMTS